MKTRILFGLLLITASVGVAQTMAPARVDPLPPGPLLNRAPEFSQWIITFSSKTNERAQSAVVETGDAKKPAKLQTVVVTKTKDVILEQSVDDKGNQVETWRKGGIVLSKPRNGKDWSASTGIGDPFDTPDYASSDFAGFQWISPSNYTGIQSVQGRKCIVFTSRSFALARRDAEIIGEFLKRQIVAEMMAGVDTEGKNGDKVTLNAAKTKAFDKNDYLVETVAYVDLETRLPVLLVYADRMRSYQFRDIQHTELAFPQDAENTATAYMKYVQRLSGNAARP